MLGGLITRRERQEREQGPPWLGDLPYLGALFRYRTQQRLKSELIIIMTPHIMNSKADGPASSFLAEEAHKMDWIPSNVNKVYGDTGAFFNPQPSTTAPSYLTGPAIPIGGATGFPEELPAPRPIPGSSRAPAPIPGVMPATTMATAFGAVVADGRRVPGGTRASFGSAPMRSAPLPSSPPLTPIPVSALPPTRNAAGEQIVQVQNIEPAPLASVRPGQGVSVVRFPPRRGLVPPPSSPIYMAPTAPPPPYVPTSYVPARPGDSGVRVIPNGPAPAAALAEPDFLAPGSFPDFQAGRR